MNLKLISFVVSTLALSGMAAQAQDIRYGGQVTLAKPMGDAGSGSIHATTSYGAHTWVDGLDGKLGIGIGGHAFFYLKDGHAIMPRIDYMTFQNTVDRSTILTNVSSSNRAKLSAFTFGADYNYFLEKRPSYSWYVLGGLGFSSAKIEDSVDYVVGNYIVNAHGSQSKTALYIQFGGGYFFTPKVAAELRYHHVSYSDVALTMGNTTYSLGSLSAPSFNASFFYRF